MQVRTIPADGRRSGIVVSGSQKCDKITAGRVKKRLKGILSKPYENRTADERAFVDKHGN